MKNFKKRIIAFVAICCVAITAIGCSNSDKSSKSGTEEEILNSPIEYETNENGAYIKAPLQEVAPGVPGISVDDGVDIDAPDNVQGSTSKKEPATAYVVATDSNNQPVTEMVPVTDASGEKMTDADGQEVTEAVTVTEVVTVEPTEPEEEYVSKTKKKYLYWMDISKNADFKFEGQFIKLKFKIKDDAPERDYPVTINPDFAADSGVSLNNQVRTLNGTIRVGGDIEEQDISSLGGIKLYADNVSAKPGESVECYLNIKDNPGMVAAIIWVSYDSNAMDFTGFEPVGEFKEIAKGVSTGSQN